MRSTTLYSAITAISTLTLGTDAALSKRNFAVLRFNQGEPLVEGRIDPIVQPGGPSAHVHTVMGASNFGFNTTGQDLVNSKCTNAKVKGDMSAYWIPKLYFHDKDANTFEPVDMFYMNVYYFFDATNDDIKAFPLGLQMVAGDALTRVAPATKGSVKITGEGKSQPASWTCPRSSYPFPSWPEDSDGSKAGFGGPNKGNKGEGVGFPFANCDGYASPLRADLHFPSCYNPAEGLTNWKTNMAYPNDVGGKLDCPKGYIHVPHMFFEMYWNTPKFSSRWTPNQGYQPFVLSNGDRTGFSMHGDFMSGWDEKILQNIIDNCDTGHAGLHACPGVQENTQKCSIDSPIQESISGKLSALPGSNPLAGWGVGNTAVVPPSTEPAKVESPKVEAPKVQGPAIDVKAPVLETPTPTPEPPAPTPAPELTSKVVETVDAAGQPTVVTIVETVTHWVTHTVTYDAEPTGLADAAQALGQKSQNVAGWTSQGCFKDNKDRVIQGEKFPQLGPMTNAKCVEHCNKAGFTIAATEYAGECFCGNSFVGAPEKIEDSTCNMPCAGNADEKCGGNWALSVFTREANTLQKRSLVDINSMNRRHLHNHMLHHRSNNGQHYFPRRR